MNSNTSASDKQPTVSIEISDALATSLSSGGEINDEQKAQLADAAKNAMSSKSADSSPPVSEHLKRPGDRLPVIGIGAAVAALLGFLVLATPVFELPALISFGVAILCLLVLLTPLKKRFHKKHLEMINIFLAVYGLTSAISAFVLQYAT